MTAKIPALFERLRSCRLCVDRFAATATAHDPRPVVWFLPSARILVAGQAPGLRVHNSLRPFSDPSGQRLRDWMGLDEAAFYDPARIAIVPMAFCFPGHDAKGADLPPPSLCATRWRAEVLSSLPRVRLTLLLGAAAMRWHLGPGAMAGHVARWQDHAARGIWPLPHPSWRNTGWIKRNPWFTATLLPELRRAIRGVLEE